MSATVDGNDMWVLLLDTIRYSLGRSTYMTSLSWELVLKYNDALEEHQLRQICREIIDEVHKYRRLKKRLADESTWVRGYIAIRRLIRRRRRRK